MNFSKEQSNAFDLILMCRGGGSIEDLWCFNHEDLARKIHRLDIPLISAVGHEIDFTISDFVADVRAPTPSAAAEIVIPQKTELQYQIKSQTRHLHQAMRKRLEQTRLHVDYLANRLIDPRAKLKAFREQLEQRVERLFYGMRVGLREKRQRFQTLTQQLQLLSPLEVLGRGYSITWSESHSIARKITDLPVGSKITTRVSDGSITAEVLSHNPESR